MTLRRGNEDATPAEEPGRPRSLPRPASSSLNTPQLHMLHMVYHPRAALEVEGRRELQVFLQPGSEGRSERAKSAGFEPLDAEATGAPALRPCGVRGVV